MHLNGRVWAGFLLFATTGCGGAPETVAVDGRLEIAGQQADNISVQFVPDSSGQPAGWKAAGVTDAAGRFVLSCEDGRAGAVPGRYHVLLDDLTVYANPRNDLPPEQRKKLIVSRIPQAYRVAGSTPLKVTIESKSQEVMLKVKP